MRHAGSLCLGNAIHVSMCILTILMAGMKPLMVRPPVARRAVHVEACLLHGHPLGSSSPANNLELDHGALYPPKTIRRISTMFESRYYHCLPRHQQESKRSVLGLINRLTVQWVLQARVTCKDKVLTVTYKENCAKWRQGHPARQYRTTD